MNCNENKKKSSNTVNKSNKLTKMIQTRYSEKIKTKNILHHKELRPRWFTTVVSISHFNSVSCIFCTDGQSQIPNIKTLKKLEFIIYNLITVQCRNFYFSISQMQIAFVVCCIFHWRRVTAGMTVKNESGKWQPKTTLNKVFLHRKSRWGNLTFLVCLSKKNINQFYSKCRKCVMHRLNLFKPFFWRILELQATARKCIHFRIKNIIQLVPFFNYEIFVSLFLTFISHKFLLFINSIVYLHN